MGTNWLRGNSNLTYVEMPFAMRNFGQIENPRAGLKIVFNEGYTTGTYSMFNQCGSKKLVLDFPSTLTDWSNGSIWRNSNSSLPTLIFRGNVGNFSNLKSNTNGGQLATAIYVPDQYYENYYEYLAGYTNQSRLHRLSEYVES